MDWLTENLQFVVPVVVGLLAIFAGFRIITRRQRQTQTGGNKSKNIQAGRDISIRRGDED